MGMGDERESQQACAREILAGSPDMARGWCVLSGANLTTVDLRLCCRTDPCRAWRLDWQLTKHRLLGINQHPAHRADEEERSHQVERQIPVVEPLNRVGDDERVQHR